MFKYLNMLFISAKTNVIKQMFYQFLIYTLKCETKSVFQGQIMWNSHRFESYQYMFKYLNILFISVKKNCCKTNVLSSD